MKTTQRFCLTLDLKDNPELIEEYKYWHQPDHIWPEITKGIASVGITNMDIYLLGTRLVMIIEAGPDFDFQQSMEQLATLPRQQEWEEFVSGFQKAGPDASSGEKWQRMDQIFSLALCL